MDIKENSTPFAHSPSVTQDTPLNGSINNLIMKLLADIKEARNKGISRRFAESINVCFSSTDIFLYTPVITLGNTTANHTPTTANTIEEKDINSSISLI